MRSVTKGVKHVKQWEVILLNFLLLHLFHPLSRLRRQLPRKESLCVFVTIGAFPLLLLFVFINATPECYLTMTAKVKSLPSGEVARAA